MLPSIPASHIVSINPAVLGAGGRPMSLNTVMLTDTGPYPINEYGSADMVGDVYGLNSIQHNFAKTYFNGYEGGTIKPGALFIARFNTSVKAATLIGASVRSLSLEELKNLSGDITVTIDGTAKTGTVDLTSVTSFSLAAAKIATAISATVEFNTQLQAFVIQSATTGESSTITYATGILAQKLGLTELTGAIVDNATTADTIDSAIERVTDYTLNFGVITHLGETFELSHCKEIAIWNSKQNHRYAYIYHGLEPNALVANSTNNFGSWLKETESSGTIAIYGTYEHAALAAGFAGSINFAEYRGRATMEFKRQAGISASVTDKRVAIALESNGYAYYGAFGTANDRFVFFKNTRVSGDFKWLDTYLNQVYFNSQLQLAFLNMLMSYKSIPYNVDGEAIHRAAAQDPINEMLNFGGIQVGIKLSEGQANQVNYESGFDAARQIESTGYCLLLGQATAQERSERKSLPAKLWYTDGGSVHSVNLASINIL